MQDGRLIFPSIYPDLLYLLLFLFYYLAFTLLYQHFRGISLLQLTSIRPQINLFYSRSFFIIRNKLSIFWANCYLFWRFHQRRAFLNFRWVSYNELCIKVGKFALSVSGLFVFPDLREIKVLFSLREFIKSLGFGENNVCSLIKSVLDNLNNLFEWGAFGSCWSVELRDDCFSFLFMLPILFFSCERTYAFHRKRVDFIK